MKIFSFIRDLFRKFPYLLAGNTLLLVVQSLIGVISIVSVAPIIDILLNPDLDLENASSITRQAAAWMESVGLPATLGSFLAVFLAVFVTGSLSSSRKPDQPDQSIRSLVAAVTSSGRVL